MNVLTDPLSGNIYFDSCASQHTSTPNLTGTAVSLGFDGCAGLTVTSYNADSQDRLTVAGASGSLFSVNDSLTGTVFSVNDASGLPIIEVNSDATTDTIAIGEYGTNALFVSAGNVGVGTTTPTSSLDVAGNIGVTGTVDGRDLAADGSKLDGIACGAGAGTVTEVRGCTNISVTNGTGVACVNMSTGGAGAGAYGSTADNIKIDTICLDAYGRVTCITTGGTGCGDITAVVAGSGLTGGATSGSATVNVGAGTAITVAADTVGVTSACNTAWNAKTTCTGTVDTSGTPVDNDFAKFTDANTIEGRSCSEVRSDLGIGTAASCAVGCFLGINAKAADSQNLDGIDSTQFLRSDTADTASGTINFSSSICVGGNITHTGDDNTRIAFATDQIALCTAGENHIYLSDSGVTINEGGLANDFRVESDNNTHALFVDGSADKVGIGCNAPSQTLAVAGTGLFTSDLTVQGDLTVTGDFTCLDTTISVTSALSVQNAGTGPALIVNQTGSNDIVDFRDDGTSAFYIEDGGFVGLNCTNPVQRLDVNGNVNTSGDYRIDTAIVISSGRCFVGTQVRPTTAIADAYIASAACWNACATSTQGTTADNALPKSGGTMSGHLNMGNNNICGINAIQIADPGPNEGVTWCNTKIFESPDNLTTNSAGNLQMVYGSTRRLTVNNTGIDVNGNIVVSGTVDGRDVAADGSKLDGIACGATANTGDITAVVAGTNLNGGATSGSATINLDGNVTGLTCLVVDDITVNGSLISNAGNGHLCVCGGGDIALDSTNGDIKLRDAGTDYGRFVDSSNNFIIQSLGNDKDLIFCGYDNGSGVTALRLDMSDAGTAVFSNKVCMSNSKLVLNGTAVTSTATELNLLDGCSSACGIDCVGDITQVVAGTNLTGGGTAGCVTINMATGGAGAGTYGSTSNSCKIDSITLDAYGRVTAVACGSTCIGDITGVTAGTGMTGGGTSGAVTLNVIGGSGITANADNITVDSTVIRTTSNQNMSGIKCFESGILTNTVTNCSGQQLVLNAGESASYATGQTAENIYLNAESGIIISSSPDNWASGWAGRKETYINNTSGNSNFANNITLGGTVDGRDVAADGSKLDGIACGATACTGTVTSITINTAAGLDGGGGTTTSSGTFDLSLDLSELTDMTAAVAPASDELILLDSGAERRKLFCEIFGSNAYNSTTIPTNNNQLTNGAGYTTCTGTGDITAVVAGSGLTGGATSGSATVNVGAGTAITVAADTVSVTSACNTAWNAKTTCTGTTTPSNTQTFTNKSGNISQWTNDSGYTTCTGTGDITAVVAGTNLNGGATSGSATVNLDTNISITSATIGSGVTLGESSDRADLLYVQSATSSWGGLQIGNTSNEFIFSLMGDGSTGGIYDDQQNEWIILWIENAGVNLYHNNSAKLCTTSTGVNVGGSITVSGTVDGRDVAADGAKLDGIACGATACTGTTTASNSQTFTNKGGNISQWTNNSGYTTCTGNVVTSGSTFTGNVFFSDNVRARFGDSSDLDIYHNGTSSFIDNDKNHICIRNNVDGDDGGNIYIMPHDNENGIIINDDGGVCLYNDNTLKFCTQSYGTRTTGTACASYDVRAPYICGTSCVNGGAAKFTTTGVGGQNAQNYWGLVAGNCAGCVCGCMSGGSILACGNVNICGTLAKASGCFDIAHPLPALSATKRLSHSFVESPQADNIYSGVVQLTGGSATVNIDEIHGMTSGTLTALNRCFRTFTTNETNWDPVRGSVTNNTLTIESCVADSTATVSWMVLGERHDPHMLANEHTDNEGRARVEYTPPTDVHSEGKWVSV